VTVAGTAGEIVGQHDSSAYGRALARRDDSALPFDIARIPDGLPVLLDTNVYLRRLRGTLPREIIALLLERRVLHSGVACAELAIGAGILDPSHPDTGRNRGAIMALLGTIPTAEMIAPSAAAWAEAGVIAGILARTQYLDRPRRTLTPEQVCCQEGLRRKLLNDALLFLGAHEQGAVLLSSNSTDMDLLLRFKPDADVLLFR
jgi:predicted nucleic acid-binding protein